MPMILHSSNLCNTPSDYSETIYFCVFEGGARENAEMVRFFFGEGGRVARCVGFFVGVWR